MLPFERLASRPSTATRSSPARARSRSSSASPAARSPCAGVTVVGRPPDAPPPGDPRPDDARAARRRPRARRADRRALGLRGDDLRPLRLRPRRPGRDDPGVARARGAAARTCPGASARRGSSATTRRSRSSRGSTTACAGEQPGFVSRSKAWWELRKLDDRPERRRGAGELNRVLLEIDGKPAGYAPLPDQGRVRGRDEQEPGAGARGDRRLARRGAGALALPARRSTGWTRSSATRCPPTTRCSCSCSGRTASTGRSSTASGSGSSTRRGALGAIAVAGDGRVTFDVTADPIFPDNVGTWTVEDGAARRSTRRRRPPARRPGARVRLPRRLHVRRARARGSGRGGRARRHRPGRCALPRRPQALVPRDLLNRG